MALLLTGADATLESANSPFPCKHRKFAPHPTFSHRELYLSLHFLIDVSFSTSLAGILIMFTLQFDTPQVFIYSP